MVKGYFNPFFGSRRAQGTATQLTKYQYDLNNFNRCRIFWIKIKVGLSGVDK